MALHWGGGGVNVAFIIFKIFLFEKKKIYKF